MSANPPEMPARRAEVLAEVVAHVRAIMTTDFGATDEVATHVGHALADHLADNWGGQIINFPKDFYYRLCLREVEILRKLDQGATLGALAREYKLTERGLRKLSNRARARQDNTDQGDLFAE